ncbi:hypothetical protein IHE55_16175 [Streptomyces pactum]|uniref:Ketoacyl-ACP synthase n=1 Tax=Streptomyces pactum TaxID=68249 RepID=A8R0J6_9ACTN|nr:beta-ketoacyl synthase N-terminal-like domain-containing protein [Streptomyces pactum]ACJ24869.1 putative ketoacyl-ACP synthase [Streptomyces pactum]MBH5336235.1 hypothetical protein [Streptomyces pactum]BAF92595.1 ketoacyl-ACP synthase [Streptomyces pactum]
MTAPRAGTVVVGGTAAERLAELRSRPDLAVTAPAQSLATAFTGVLTAALAGLPAGHRRQAPVVMAATDYAVAATSGYVARCAEAEAGGRRLRPSEAMTPEPAQLLQELAERTDWQGPGHVLISPRSATWQAVRWAFGAVSAGLHPAMVVCEVARDPAGGGYRVAAVPVTAPGPHADPPTGPVVISGTGLVTAFGDGADTFWRNLLAGRRGTGELTRFDAGRFRSRTVCQTTVAAAPGRPVRRALVDRARAEALAEAGLGRLPERTLLVYAGVVPHLPAVAGAPGVGEIALEPEWDGDGFGAAPGDRVLMAHACASGAFGLAMAREWLLCGLADTAVIVGVSALNTYDYACLDVLRATTTGIARPFDEDRSGVTVGEGAGVIVLETAARAAARGHRPPAVLAGISCRVAGQGVSALSTRVGAVCMREALAMAGLRTVDYVHGHAPGTRQGDEAELRALDQVGAELGWRDVPVSSCKGASGHLLHASVFPAVVTAVRALRDGVLPGTPGLRTPLGARHVRVLRDAESREGLSSVLVDNFGFGGNNAAFLLTGDAAGHLEWSAHG